MDQPLVSVVMPVLNGQPFLDAAIKSILRQSYPHFEFLILNDASEDNSLSVMKSYLNPKIRILDFQERQGLNKILNIGVAESKGGYIMRMDADDISISTRMEQQVAYLETHPEVGICSSWIERFDDQRSFGISRGYSDDAFLKLELLYRPGFAHPSVMYRKKLFDGGAKYKVFHADDYDLWTQLAFETRFYKIPKSLLYYRVHTDQFTQQFSTRIKGSLVEVQSAFLARVQIKLPDNCRAIHRDLTFYEYTFSGFYLSRVAVYFKRLESQLANNAFFSKRHIPSYIDDQFYRICSHFTKKGVPGFWIYFHQRRVFDARKIIILLSKYLYRLVKPA